MVANTGPAQSGQNPDRNPDGTWAKGNLMSKIAAKSAGRPLGSRDRTKAVEEAVCALAGREHSVEGLAEGVKKFPMELLAGMFGRTLTQHVEADVTDRRPTTLEELDTEDERWASRLQSARGNGH